MCRCRGDAADNRRTYHRASTYLRCRCHLCAPADCRVNPSRASDHRTTTAATAAPGGPTAPPPTSVAAVVGGRLKSVLDRGNLICGVNGQTPGFSVLEADGSYSGIDAEFCRAVAAALFNDVSKVEYRPLSAAARFAAVQSGEVDVLIRNTTFTTNRDTAVGLEFLPTTFFDGGGLLVEKSLERHFAC